MQSKHGRSQKPQLGMDNAHWLIRSSDRIILETVSRYIKKQSSLMVLMLDFLNKYMALGVDPCTRDSSMIMQHSAEYGGTVS